ncbi:MAG: A/G-specific adenine glycosylase [Bacteroidetes bacterium]|nr:A/G-specific adenine glycosylase [Bacteroidota bacterium]
MKLQKRLANWYQLNKRELPWRSTSNPYFIWLSEIILQQTRVQQGLPYYLRFVESFSTIAEFADATEQEILKLWQGLGYYSRARNMLATARQLVTEHGSKFPNTYEGLLKLKGIGDYTASAIGSISFNLPCAVLDGNVFRVLSRLYNAAIPIDSNEGKKFFSAKANELLDIKKPGAHNQAMMELGATICTPVNPLCSNCPLSLHCRAFIKSTVEDLPVKSLKTKVRNRHVYYFILKSKHHMIITKRTGNDIWKGLYDFPSVELVNNKKKVIQVAEEFLVTHRLKNCSIEKISTGRKHILSHQRLFATFILISCKRIVASTFPHSLAISIKEFENYPVPKLIENMTGWIFE